MRVVIGSDLSGFHLKAPLIAALDGWGYGVEDVGGYTPEWVDFPLIAERVCNALRDGRADRRVIVCGTGVGACIAANKMPGIRAALCHDIHSAHQCVEHDFVTILCLGAKIVGEWLAQDLLKAFLGAHPSREERFVRRDAKLTEMETRLAQERTRT